MPRHLCAAAAEEGVSPCPYHTCTSMTPTSRLYRMHSHYIRLRQAPPLHLAAAPPRRIRRGRSTSTSVSYVRPPVVQSLLLRNLSYTSWMAKKHISLEEMEEYNMVINQMLRSVEDGYKFYNAYAKSKGFSVRKANVKRKKGTNMVIWRRFCCSNEGYKMMKYFERTNQKREPQPLTRFGCEAKLEIECFKDLCNA